MLLRWSRHCSCGPRRNPVKHIVQQQQKQRQQLFVRLFSSRASNLPKTQAAEITLFWDISASTPDSIGIPAAAKALRKVLGPHGVLLEKRVYWSDPIPDHQIREMTGFTNILCGAGDGDNQNGVLQQILTDVLQFAWQKVRSGVPGIACLVCNGSHFASVLGRVGDLGVKTVVVHAKRDAGALLALGSAADVVLSWDDVVNQTSTGLKAAAALEGFYPDWEGLTPDQQFSCNQGMSDGGEDFRPGVTRASTAVSRQLPSPAALGGSQPQLPSTKPAGHSPAVDGLGAALACRHSDKVTAEAADAAEPPLGGKLLSWAQLGEEDKKAAAVLGYGEEAWEAGEETDCSSTPWSQLLPQERQAAQQLGFSPEEWDSEIEALLPGVVVAGRTRSREVELQSLPTFAAADNVTMPALPLDLHAGGSQSQLHAWQNCARDLQEAFDDDIALGLVSAHSVGNS